MANRNTVPLGGSELVCSTEMCFLVYFLSQFLLLFEPPHFGKHHSHQNPDHPIREIASQLGGQVRVAPVGSAPEQEPPNFQSVGILRRKFATHVNQLEIGTH